MKRIDDKTMVLSDGFVIKINETYRWSGYNEGLYVDTRWSKSICKVMDIKDKSFIIYDDGDNKMYTINESYISKSHLKFDKK